MAAQNETGLILCECGNILSNLIDFEEVTTWALDNNIVDFVLRYDLLCSPQGKDYLKRVFQERHPQKMIIAACSPRQHEKTFQTIARECDANTADIHMANIREHAAWVTPGKPEATKKAIALINAAVKRAALHQPLEQKQIDVITDLVVIGGGIAGMEAALLAAESGRKVTIIEKNIALGGRIIQTEELYPNMECSPCLISPRLFKIKDHQNITVLSNAEATEVLGFYGHFTVKGLQKPRYVNTSCIGCEACFHVCPVSVPDEFHLGLGQRKAIHSLFPGAVPAMAAIDHQACLHFKDGSCNACQEHCPFAAVDFKDKERYFEIDAGAIIVATGSASFNPGHIKRLGYQKYPNIFTLPEFERLSDSNGPTQGKIILANGTAPASVAVIHCAGSLSHDEGLQYCSGLCCQLAVKTDITIRKQLGNVEITHIHDRLIINTPEAERLYQQQLDNGSRFIKTGQLDTLQIKSQSDTLIISGNNFNAFQADMVILATGLLPSEDSNHLAGMIGLEKTAAGFFKPEQSFLRAMATTSDGIYIAGGCSGPCFIKDAVLQGQSAAGEAISRLVPGRKIELETTTACIDDTRCAGCRLCISVCPYHAVSPNKEKGIAEINETICRGCGTCVANCPSGAAQARHFTSEQLEAEIEGILNE